MDYKNRTMILICSDFYVVSTLAEQVGLLPPSFLPIGNRRLYEYQIEFLKTLGADIYLSIPEGYHISEFDVRRLNELSVKLIKAIENISLGASILNIWLSIGKKYKNLIILLGDRLFYNLDILVYQGYDMVSVCQNRSSLQFKASTYHHKRSYKLVIDDNWITSGLFSFTKPYELIQNIIDNNNNFIAALSDYINNHFIKINNEGKCYNFTSTNSFFMSRSEITTQRAFNYLNIFSKKVVKSSHKKQKILAESNWYCHLPAPLHLYTPTLLVPYYESNGLANYEIEYLYLLPLNDLLVFSEISVNSWVNILNKCKSLILEFSKYTPKNIDTHSLCDKTNKIYLSKSLKRVEKINGTKIGEYINELGFTNKKLKKILYEVNHYIQPLKANNLSVVHGDFCFSNILYDNKLQVLKILDPRGMDGDGELSIYGDIRYDVAKLYHSAVGYYDLIIANRFYIDNDLIYFELSSCMQQLENIFEELFFNSGLFLRYEIIAINVMLFISMIPLHADNLKRQQAMFLNAIRLFHKLKKQN